MTAKAEKPMRPLPTDADRDMDAYWKPLGHHAGVFFVFDVVSGEVRDYTGTGSLRVNLLELAPLAVWRRAYPAKEEGSFSKDAAVNRVIQDCKRMGLFDPSMLRGVGAWLDERRLVFNTGRELVLVDKLGDFGPRPKTMPADDWIRSTTGLIRKQELEMTRYIYSREPQAVSVGCALGADELEKISKACRLLNWKSPLMADLILGWVVIAVLGGTLPWRPHLFLTGQTGVGKTTVIQKFVMRLLHGFIIARQGSTTEAAYRALIGKSSRGVLYEEAERNNQRAEGKFTGITELARASSSGEATPISRSTSDGHVRNFTCQSAFMFCAIGSGFDLNADKSRFTEAELMGKAPKADYEEFLAIMDGLAINDDLPANFIATCLLYEPTFRVNYKRLISALCKHTDSRTADQIGMTMAASLMFGDWSELTPEQADILAAGITVGLPGETHLKDQEACLIELQQHVVRRENGATMRVQQMVENALTATNKKEFREELKWLGIAVDDDWVTVAESHKFIKEVYQREQFAKTYNAQLRRIEGAVEHVSVRWDRSMNPGKGTKIPRRYFVADNEMEKLKGME